MARILDTPVAYFFDEMTADVQAQTPSNLLEQRKLPELGHDRNPMARRETLELVRAYYKIPDPKIRKRVFELTKMVAKSS